MSRNPILPEYSGRIPHIRPTPLLPIRLYDHSPEIWCKLEFLNPSGSVKDRIARYILEKAWRKGIIGPNSTVIEASSGSTSIALARVCAQYHIKFIAVVPRGISDERILILNAYGAIIHFVEKGGMEEAIQEAEKLNKQIKGFLTRQFENPDNVNAHIIGTGNEILNQIPGGQIECVVSGVGTGGTLVGLYNAFTEVGCLIKPIAAIPIGTSVINDTECYSHSKRIPGVVEGLSKIYQNSILPDLEEIRIDDDEAIKVTRDLIKKGIPVGPSSGLNYAAALKAQKILGDDAVIVTVFCDRMERYFSTELFHHLK